jgi:hypothetical protein
VRIASAREPLLTENPTPPTPIESGLTMVRLNVVSVALSRSGNAGGPRTLPGVGNAAGLKTPSAFRSASTVSVLKTNEIEPETKSKILTVAVPLALMTAPLRFSGVPPAVTTSSVVATCSPKTPSPSRSTAFSQSSACASVCVEPLVYAPLAWFTSRPSALMVRSTPVMPSKVAPSPVARSVVQTRVSVAPTTVGGFALAMPSANVPPATER